jgi:hypothetical protein
MQRKLLLVSAAARSFSENIEVIPPAVSRPPGGISRVFLTFVSSSCLTAYYEEPGARGKEEGQK